MDGGLKRLSSQMEKGPGSPDIAYVGRQVAVFIHGCFWHSCPNCQIPRPRTNSDYWQRKFVRNKERDERKVRELRSAGWKVVQLWECQIKKDIEACVGDVRKALYSPHP